MVYLHMYVRTHTKVWTPSKQYAYCNFLVNHLIMIRVVGLHQRRALVAIIL